MYATDRIIAAAALLAALLAGSGCTSTYAPKGWLPEADELDRSAFGGWLYLTYHTESGAIGEVAGEFIATDDTTVVVCGVNGVTRIRHDAVVEAVLSIHTNNAGVYGVWTILGAVSTLTHGWFLAVSAPIWLIGGTAWTIAESNSGIYREEAPTLDWWREQSLFARFPQGLPPGIDLRKLYRK